MKEPQPFVPSDVTNIRTAITVEQALGIDRNRFRELGFIMDDLWALPMTKAEMMNSLASRTDLTPAERVYMGYKMHERICRKKIPMWNRLEAML